MSDSNLNVVVPRTLELLLTRRSGSAKAMKGPGPSADQVRTLIACASRVPDHGKLTPWRFVIFEGEARAEFGEVLVRALKTTEPDASEERQTQERNRFLRAPAVIAVISRIREGIPIPEWEQTLSAGAACQTLCIAAHAMGFVANWITEWYAYHPVVREALGMKSGERVAGYIYLGHPAADLADRPRPEINTIATHWRSAVAR
ncbi:MAG: nitroreductase [Alphaproteobacteria bacterium]|nr:nitroreductase [Alphaproteobacteria bacterium]